MTSSRLLPSSSSSRRRGRQRVTSGGSLRKVGGATRGVVCCCSWGCSLVCLLLCKIGAGLLLHGLLRNRKAATSPVQQPQGFHGQSRAAVAHSAALLTLPIPLPPFLVLPAHAGKLPCSLLPFPPSPLRPRPCLQRAASAGAPTPPLMAPPASCRQASARAASPPVLPLRSGLPRCSGWRACNRAGWSVGSRCLRTRCRQQSSLPPVPS